MTETNFDEYLRSQLKDPEFKRKHEIWLKIWEVIMKNNDRAVKEPPAIKLGE